MRPIRLIALAALLPLGLAACNNDTAPQGTPIDCSTLATSLATTTDLVAADSGLRYRDQVVGTGSPIVSGQLVSVHYAGCLTSGAVFDQSLDTDAPLVFNAGDPRYISGFSKGVIGMKVGGTRQLVIPSTLGYGANDYGPIPGGSTLVFTVILQAAQ